MNGLCACLAGNQLIDSDDEETIQLSGSRYTIPMPKKGADETIFKHDPLPKGAAFCFFTVVDFFLRLLFLLLATELLGTFRHAEGIMVRHTPIIVPKKEPLDK